MVTGVYNSTYSFQTQLAHSLQRQDSILTRLATGRKINKGSDDPAGMISATQLEQAIAALEAESRAMQRVSSNATIADGHAAQLSSMMTELRGLAVASANSGALSDDEVAANQMQVDSLVANIQQYAQQFADSLGGVGMPGDGADELVQQISAAAASVASLSSAGANALGAGNLSDIQSVIEQAATAFSEARGQLGAHHKYNIESRQNTIAVERESLLTAHSRIMDVDYAEETSNLAMAQVSVAAGIEVLRIANHNNETILGLLS